MVDIIRNRSEVIRISLGYPLTLFLTLAEQEFTNHENFFIRKSRNLNYSCSHSVSMFNCLLSAENTTRSEFPTEQS